MPAIRRLTGGRGEAGNRPRRVGPRSPCVKRWRWPPTGTPSQEYVKDSSDVRLAVLPARRRKWTWLALAASRELPRALGEVPDTLIARSEDRSRPRGERAPRAVRAAGEPAAARASGVEWFDSELWRRGDAIIPHPADLVDCRRPVLDPRRGALKAGHDCPEYVRDDLPFERGARGPLARPRGAEWEIWRGQSPSKGYLASARASSPTAGSGDAQRAKLPWRLEVEGELDESSFVWDFGTLKRLMRRLVDELDHRMLLPRDNPELQVKQEGDSVEVLYKERRYVFPRSDVVLVPVPNTTAEMLARYLAGRVKEELQREGAKKLSALAVEVEESFGQSAWCRDACGNETSRA